ncbi:MAG: rhamnulokinase [Armatimonadetes bacterium]|nr:rhamnulokinase [Armatimonadota bacterium]
MATQQFLAVDLGAESGRGMLGAFDGARVTLRELGRFATSRGEQDIGPDGVRRWDWPRITGEIRALLRQAQGETGGALAGVGVDSWGVDFGLLDAQGRLLEMPLHYRNDANPPAMARALGVIAKEELWAATGIQPLAFNTLFQLAAVQAREPSLLKRAATLLFVPDLAHHALTGGAARGAERTEASTSQMMTPGARAWQPELLTRLGMPSQFLGPLVEPGSPVGTAEGGTPIYAPATHDTASAVAAVPFEAGRAGVFLSSGTWSLFGVERPSPVLSLDALNAGFSNEGGVAGTTRFLKNIMGLWLVQECRRSLRRSEGRDYSYAELTALAAEAPADGPLVDAADPRFLAPPDMADEIRTACRESGQPEPEGAEALIRCCLESLALAYRHALENLSRITGMAFEVIHIVGGGSQNKVLNQWAADACGLPVIAGPGEVTALGNVLGQLVASGAVKYWAEARQVSRQSAAGEEFTPDPVAHATWDERAAHWERLRVDAG